MSQCLVFASSCLQPFNSEDIVALMKYTLPVCKSMKGFLVTWKLTVEVGHEKLLKGLYDVCDIIVDFTSDKKADVTNTLKLLTNIALVRCLSVQQTLEDDDGVRTIPAKAASIMLELRNICVSVHTAMNTQEEIREGSFIGMCASREDAMRLVNMTRTVLQRRPKNETNLCFPSKASSCVLNLEQISRGPCGE